MYGALSHSEQARLIAGVFIEQLDVQGPLLAPRGERYAHQRLVDLLMFCDGDLNHGLQPVIFTDEVPAVTVQV